MIMPTFQLKNTQRRNEFFKASIFQIIATPLLLSCVAFILFIAIYRNYNLKIIDQSAIEQSFSGNSSISVVSMDLYSTSQTITFTEAIKEEFQVYYETFMSMVDGNINITCKDLLSIQHNTKQMFEDELSIAYNYSNIMADNDSNFKTILDSLNSTIMSNLTEQGYKVQQLQQKLESAVFVGDSVDASDLSSDFAYVSDLFSNALANVTLDSDNSNDRLEVLNETKDEFLSAFDKLFEDAIVKIKDIDLSFEYETGGYHSLSFSPQLLNQSIIKSNLTNSSGTTSAQQESFIENSDAALIGAGVVLGVIYVSIVVYKWFRFRYECSTSVAAMVECEKSGVEIDFIDFLNKRCNPVVDLVTDLECQISGMHHKREKLFWLNSYYIGEASSIPALLVFVFIIGMAMLCVSKLTPNLNAQSLDRTNGTMVMIQKWYNFSMDTNFTDLADQMNSATSAQLDQFNAEMNTQFDNLTQSIRDLCETYNTTTFLGSTSLNLTQVNVTFPSFSTNISTIVSSINSINLRSDAQIQASNFAPEGIAQSVLDIFSATIISTLRIAIIALSSLVVFFVLAGFCYSLLL